MSERRWDIVLRIASGPLASRTPAVYHGPTVSVGTAPRGAGVVLPGGRGIAPEHCTLSAYDPHTVFVTPGGHNPVRIAPYADVRWEELEPITGRVRLERGNAIHLGPTGQRGVTLEFVECRDLGMVTVERIVSDTADTTIFARPPDGIRARGKRPDVRQVITDTLDPSSFRLLLTALLGGAGVLTMVALVLIARLMSKPLTEHGEVNWYIGELPELPKLTDAELSETLDVDYGTNDPFIDFIIGPNIRYAGGDLGGQLGDDTKRWDLKFIQAARKTAENSHNNGCYYRVFEEAHDHYRTVLQTLHESDLCVNGESGPDCTKEPMPDIFAAIPMQESLYGRRTQSQCCAEGPWQFMPEFGPRMSRIDPQLAVKACHWKNAPDAATWTPKDLAPPQRACDNTHPTAEYVEPGMKGAQCRIASCETDFRTDWALSTKAAMIALRQPLEDADLRASGAALQIAIASHNAGYNDREVVKTAGYRKPYNMLPSYLKWRSDNPNKPTSHFLGDAMRCVPDASVPGCEAYMKAETQEYVYRIAAFHLLAICYYGKNYANDPVFAPWAAYSEPGGYCTLFSDKRGVPSPKEALSRCGSR